MKFEDLDLEKAHNTLRESIDAGLTTEKTTLEVVYSAIPPITPWDGKSDLRINHHALVNDFIVVVRAIDTIHKDVAVAHVDKGSLHIVPLTQIKPIPPKPKKINHSSLVGSGIDCVYSNRGIDFIAEYDKDSHCLNSIRMNHTMVLTEKQVEAIPEGYEYEETPIGIGTESIVIVTGVEEGYEL